MARTNRTLHDRWREAYSPLPVAFTNNLQIWLAFLAFALFIVTLLWDYVWGWWKMLEQLSPLAWVAYSLGSITVLFFSVIALVSFVSFLIVVWRGWFGIKSSSSNVSTQGENNGNDSK